MLQSAGALVRGLGPALLADLAALPLVRAAFPRLHAEMQAALQHFAATQLHTGAFAWAWLQRDWELRLRKLSGLHSQPALPACLPACHGSGAAHDASASSTGAPSSCALC